MHIIIILGIYGILIYLYLSWERYNYKCIQIREAVDLLQDYRGLCWTDKCCNVNKYEMKDGLEEWCKMGTINIVRSKYSDYRIPKYIEEDIDKYVSQRKDYQDNPIPEKLVLLKLLFDNAYTSIKHGAVNGFYPDCEMQRLWAELREY